MAQLKTQPNDADVTNFLNSVPNERRRKDAFSLLQLMKEVTGEEAVMWGDSIIGFGTTPLKYADGSETDWMLVGFSPRKRHLVLYNLFNAAEADALLAKLGKHKTGKSCLYITRLEQVDSDVLRELIKQSVDQVRATDPTSK